MKSHELSVMGQALCGTSVPRIDGKDKVEGRTRFLGDIEIPGLWHGAVVRSPAAKGRIRGVAFDPSFDWTRVVTVKAGEIPGQNIIPIIRQDMPCLADERVSYLGEPVILIAAPSLGILQGALRSVRIDVQRSEPLFGIESLIQRYKKDPHAMEVLHALTIEKGDPGKGFADADRIVEGEYFTGPQEQGYLEPQGIIATPQKGGVHILGSLQCPFYVRPAVAFVLGVPEERVVVEQTPTGGAFGGKEDYPSFLAAYASLLALKSDKPVRMLLARHEDMSVTPKRHASWTRFKAGVKRDGTLTAAEIEFILDGGAYITLTPVVLSRGAIHAAGPYRCPNVRITAKALRSNTPPAGAFRGFGVPQALFACESHMDAVARSLGMDPMELRGKNALSPGDTTATGQVLKESVGARACREAVMEACGYGERRRAIEEHNTREGAARRGLGAALFWHGGGFTGSGEERIAARAGLELCPGGAVEIRVSSTEMGQGSLTTLSQIVGDACSIDLKHVRHATPNTSGVPDSGPTVASRTTMIVGKILETCGRALVSEMTERMGNASRDGSGFMTPEGALLTWAEAADRALDKGLLYVERPYEPPPGLIWDEERHRGDAYAAYAWGAVVVEVSVDTVTCAVTPREIWCAVDMGKAINPQAAQAQVEGGLVQALGYGLLEQLTFSKEGAYQEIRFQDYILPTAADVPPLHVELIEIPYSRGPSGAKGLGELPMNGLAPALGNALCHALGIPVNKLPMTPERILAAMETGSDGDLRHWRPAAMEKGNE